MRNDQSTPSYKVEILKPNSSIYTEIDKLKTLFVSSFQDIKSMRHYNTPGMKEILEKILEDEISDFIRPENRRLFVLCRDDQQRIVGFLILSIMGYPQHVYFRQGAVAPDSKHKGVLTAMAKYLRNTLSHYLHAYAITRKVNQEAITIYEKMGLQPTDQLWQEVAEVVREGYSEKEYVGFKYSVNAALPPPGVTDFFRRQNAAAAYKARNERGELDWHWRLHAYGK